MHKRIVVAGIACAAFTVVSTFIVHLVEVPSDTFEERLALAGNVTYIARNITTIIHCICVAISMAAIVEVQKQFSASSAFLQWGLAGFFVFSLTEIVRMLTALIYVNGLRAQYFSLSAVQQENASFILNTQWPLAGTVMFILFILAFGFGCLFYGIDLIEKERLLGSLFLFWGVQSFFTILNDRLTLGFDQIIFVLSVTFQPIARGYIAFWLFKKLRSRL